MDSERWLERHFPKRLVQLSSYTDGLYNQDGVFSPSNDLSPAAIKVWNFNIKFETDKVWGAGQALYFNGCPLIFGSDKRSVDVVFDMNPDMDGRIQRDALVADTHFQLHPPVDNKIKLIDLESIHGIEIFSGDLKAKESLHKSIKNLETYLEVGDYIIVGQFTGFRVCQDNTGVLFLVKLAYSTKAIDSTEPASNRLEVDFSGEDEEVLYAYNYLLKSVVNLKNMTLDRNLGHRDVLVAYSDLFYNLFDFSEALGDKYYNSDWSLAADKICALAMNESAKLRTLNLIKEAEQTADLVALLNKFRTGQLCDFNNS